MKEIQNAPTRQSDIDFVYNGIFVFFPAEARDEIGTSELENLKKLYQNLTIDQFKLILFSLTSEKTVKGAINKLYELKNISDLNETVPVNLQELVDLTNAPQSDFDLTKEDVHQRIQNSINKLQEIQTEKEKHTVFKKSVFDPNTVKASTDEMYFSTEDPEVIMDLNNPENKDLRDIITLAQNNPKDFRDKTVARIIQNIPKDTKPEYKELVQTNSEIVVNDFISKALDVDLKSGKLIIDNSPFEILTTLADPKSSRIIFTNQEDAVNFSNLIGENLTRQLHDSVGAASVLSTAIGVDVGRLYIPSQTRKTTITTEQKESSFASSNVKDLINQIAQAQLIEKQIIQTVREENTETFDLLTKQQRLKIDKQAKEIAQKMQARRKAFWWLRTRGGKISLPEQRHYSRDYYYSAITESQLSSININFNSITAIPPTIDGVSIVSPYLSQIANFAMEKAIKRLPIVAKLSKSVSGLGTKLGTKLATAVGANFALPPVIGQIVSAISTALAIKDVISSIIAWAKKQGNDIYFYLAVGLGTVYFITGVPILGAVALGSLLIGGSVIIPIFLFGLIGIIGSVLLESVLIIIVGFLILGIATALIVLIINSGAYLVPPVTRSSSTPPTESEYIKVEKTADPSGPFQNNQDITVNYKVIITAKKIELTSIQFEYKCSVYSETSMTCPHPENVFAGTVSDTHSFEGIDDLVKHPPTSITPGDDFIITYIVNYPAGNYNDSSVTDTFTVQAKAEGKLTKASDSLTIIIGQPPLNCFVISFNNASRAQLENALNHMIANHPKYVTKVCGSWNTITFDFYDNAPSGVFGWWQGNGHILVSEQGMSNEPYAIYTVAHETGHALHDGLPEYFSEYLNYSGVAGERPLCTYSATDMPEEAFAESSGLFASENYYTSCHSGLSDFARLYPNHYQFVKDILYQE